jgi:hypothetical protein
MSKPSVTGLGSNVWDELLRLMMTASKSNNKQTKETNEYQSKNDNVEAI